MSRRVQLVLPEPVATQLHELAAGAQEPPATIAAQMLRGAVAEAAAAGRVRPLRLAEPRQVPAASPRPAARSRWLEPYGGDRHWSEEMWTAIVELHGRYPRHLEGLQHGWWLDESHTETLCALAVWRAEIDDADNDPREELAFQSHLAHYAQLLRAQGGGVEAAWVPGALPAEWSGPLAASEL
jgi:hypothetical protein